MLTNTNNDERQEWMNWGFDDEPESIDELYIDYGGEG